MKPLPDFPPAFAKRLMSLDILRGMALALMILTGNFGFRSTLGGTMTWLLFPAFLFAMGASVVCAFEAHELRGVSKAQMSWHILYRTGVFYLLGLAENLLHRLPVEQLFFSGVLQRIAFSYLLSSFLHLWDRRLWTKLALSAAILALYSALQAQPAGLAAYEERLSALPSLACALLGMASAYWLRSRCLDEAGKTQGLAALALLALGAGYLWSIWLPLRPALWSSSYVLAAIGWTLAALAAIHWAVEQKGWRQGWVWPWILLGVNSLAAYLAAELLGCVRESLLGPGWASAYPAPMVFLLSLLFLGLCLLPVWHLWRRRIFFKI